MNSDAARESPAATFDAGLRRGELLYQRCRACSAAVFFPRVVCPQCGSPDLDWRPSCGVGHVYSTTAVRSRRGDYNVALIDLDEGFRMMARVGGREPDEVAIGAQVKAVLKPEMGLDDLEFEQVGR